MHIMYVPSVVGYIYIYIYCRRFNVYLACSGCYSIYIYIYIYIEGGLMHIVHVRAVVGYIYARRCHSLCSHEILGLVVMSFHLHAFS